MSAASLILLTIGGLIINSIPELRIIDQTALLPVLAIWGAFNVVILFLVCMMSLQAPVRRAEERFVLDEPIGLFGADGGVSTGQIRDISLSGVAMMVDEDRPLVTEVGSYLRVYIKEVGFVPGRIVRQSGRFLALEFDLPRSLERDLLISKLFTSGLDTASTVSSAPAATIAILRSIVSVRSNESQIAN